MMMCEKYLIILCAILVIAGVALMIYGNSLNDNWQAQWNSIISDGSKNPGNPYIITGAVALGFGVLFCVFSLLGLKKSGQLPNIL